MTKKKSFSEEMPNYYGNRKHMPRQVKMLAYWLDPKSPTYNNAYRSAIRAGYSHYYAKYITSPSKANGWMRDAKMADAEKVRKAERNMDELLDMDVKNIVIVRKDGKPKVYEQTDVGLVRVKADVSKFILERLNKKKYAQRSEHTDGEGKPLAVKLDI